jgi:periplasmic divalent cation tolerance protein
MEMTAGAGTGTAAGTAAWLTVLTTTDASEKAEALARGAVEARAAACAQIAGPVTSVYRWKGAVETASEGQVLFKTTGARYDALEAYLLAAHDYDTPEIIATPVVRGSADYLRWVEGEAAAEESMEAESVTEETVAEETAE